MFLAVWRWAGRFRQSARNIGIEAHRIPVELRHLIGDISYQIEHNTYTIDESAARFHHRLVFIHPFPNGNGRHARLATDVLLKSLNQEPFTWGAGSLTEPNEFRKRYINALRQADNHNYAPLLAFVRSSQE